MNSDSNFILTFRLARTSCVHYFNLVTIAVRALILHNFGRRCHFTWHFKPSRFIFVLAIVINPRIIEILIEILNRLINITARVNVTFTHLPADNAFIIILVEQFDESIIGHLFTSLYETFPLQFDVTFLSHILLIECLLDLDRGSNFIRIQIRHVREAHPEWFWLCLIKLYFFEGFLCCVRTWN